MPPDTVLSALLTGRETISRSFDDAAESVSDYRGDLDEASASSTAYAQRTDEAGDETESFDRSLGLIPESASAMMGALFGTQESLEETGEEAGEAERKLSDYNAGLAESTGLAMSAAGANQAAASSIEEVDNAETGDLGTGLDNLRQNSNLAIGSLGDLDEETGGVASSMVATADDTDDLRDSLGELRAASSDEFLSETSLDEAHQRLLDLSDAESEAFDEIVATSDAADELETSFADLGDTTEDTEDSTGLLRGKLAELRNEFDAGEDRGEDFAQSLGLTRSQAESTSPAIAETSEEVDKLDDKAGALGNTFGGITLGSPDTEGVDDARESATGLDRVVSSLPGSISTTVASLTGMGSSADEAGDEMAESAGETAIAEGTLLSYAGATGVAAAGSEAAANAVDEAGDEATESAAEHGILGTVMGGVSGVTGALTGSMKTAEEATDEAGDEAEESANAFLRLAAGMNAATGAGTGLGGSLFGIRGGIGTLLLILPVLIGLMGALAVPMAGLATAAVGLGGALAGVFGASLISRGERLAETSSSIKDKWAGVSEIFSQVGERAADILAPLQALGGENMVMGGFEFGLSILEDLVTLTENLWPSIERVLDSWGEVSSATGGEFFAELEATIEAFLPYLAMFGNYIMKNAGPALRFLRKEGTDIIPTVSNLTNKIIDVLPPLVEFSGTVLKGAVPAIAWLIDILQGGLEYFNALPEPVKESAAQFAVFAFIGYQAIGVLSGLFGAVGAGIKLLFSFAEILKIGGVALKAMFGGLKLVVGGIGTLVGILGWPISLLIALGVAVGGVITYFGLWDEAISGVESTWNRFLKGLGSFRDIIRQGIVKGVNMAIGALSELIDAANKLPGIDIDLPEKFDLPEKTDMSQYMASEDENVHGFTGFGKESENAGGGPMSRFRGGGGSGGIPDSMPKTSGMPKMPKASEQSAQPNPWENVEGASMAESKAAGQAQGGDYTGTNIEEMTIEQPAPKEESDARNERIAKQAVEQEKSKNNQSQYGGAS
jgi:hypothetical protein